MLKQEKIKKVIVSRLATYDERAKLTTDRNDRQDRLKHLVDKYGVENVALAGGFTVSTLAQYIRVSVAPAISEDKVLKAETILKGL